MSKAIIPSNKAKGSITEKQLEQVKAALAKNPDLTLKNLIETFSLTISPSGLCHKLKRHNIAYNGKPQLTKEQNSQLMAALVENPNTPLDELIEEQSLSFTPYQLRRKLMRDGIYPKAGTVLTRAQDEQTQRVPLSMKPYVFVGRKPTAVLFGEERVDVKTWVEVYTVILKRCNNDPKGHERLMYLRNKAAGKVRVFLSGKPDGMTRPVKIDDDLYGECHYGSETLMHILVNQILAYTGFDCSAVSIDIKRNVRVTKGTLYIEILGKAAYALGKYLPESEFALFKDYLRVYETLKARNDNEKRRYQEKADYHRQTTKKWREENPEKQKQHVKNHQEKKRLERERQEGRSAWGASVVNYSPEALKALAEYVVAFDKCVKEPDETYGAAFIAMEAERERLKKSFTTTEFEAIIINIDDIRDVLRKAGLIPE